MLKKHLRDSKYKTGEDCDCKFLKCFQHITEK